MLVQSLNEQKQLATSLERMMAAQTVQLEECMDIVEREISKRKDLERKIGTHSLTHSLTHARTHLLTHSLTHSLTQVR